MPSRRLIIAALVGTALSIVALWILVTRVDFRELGDVLARANPGGVLIAIAALGVAMFLRTHRWRVIFPSRRGNAGRPAASSLFPVMLIGYAVNVLVPLRAGDGVRGVVGARRFHSGVPETLGSIGLERVLDVVALAGVTIVASTGLVAPGWLVPTAIAVLGVAAIVLSALYLLGRRARVGASDRGVIAMFWRLWKGMRSTPRAIAVALLIGALIVCADGLTAWLIAVSLGIDITWQMAMLICVGAALGTAIPAAPAAIGTFHLAGTAVGVAIGMAPAEALAVVTLWHAATVVPLVVAGGLSAPLVGFRMRDLRLAQRTSAVATLKADLKADTTAAR